MLKHQSGSCWLSCSLLRGAEEVGLRKAVKPEFGGGTRSFSCEEDYIYENIESELCFFTSQVCHTHTHTGTHTHWNTPYSPPSPHRRGRASLNTGWTTSGPNTGRCFTTSPSWRASQSVSCAVNSDLSGPSQSGNWFYSLFECSLQSQN